MLRAASTNRMYLFKELVHRRRGHEPRHIDLLHLLICLASLLPPPLLLVSALVVRLRQGLEDFCLLRLFGDS